MSDPDKDAARKPLEGASLASDIVELVVLTVDEEFLRTFRDAIGSARRVWHVRSADKVGDLLRAGQVRICVLDMTELHDSPVMFVTQIRRQFPDLIVIAAGSREIQAALASLISAGVVYRFIHKPLSPARAKSFADAAVKKKAQTAEGTPMAESNGRTPARMHASPGARRIRRNAGVSAAAAMGALALAALLWALLHFFRAGAAPPT